MELLRDCLEGLTGVALGVYRIDKCLGFQSEITSMEYLEQLISSRMVELEMKRGQ
jgi:hypothetical protein